MCYSHQWVVVRTVEVAGSPVDCSSGEPAGYSALFVVRFRSFSAHGSSMIEPWTGAYQCLLCPARHTRMAIREIRHPFVTPESVWVLHRGRPHWSASGYHNVRVRDFQPGHHILMHVRYDTRVDDEAGDVVPMRVMVKRSLFGQLRT